MELKKYRLVQGESNPRGGVSLRGCLPNAASSLISRQESCLIGDVSIGFLRMAVSPAATYSAIQRFLSRDGNF